MNATQKAKLIIQLVELGHSDMAVTILKNKNTDTKQAKETKEKSAVSLNNPQYPVASELAAKFAKVVENDMVRFVPKTGDVVEFNDRRFYGGAKDGYKVSDLMALPLANDGEIAVQKIKDARGQVVNATLRFYYEVCDRA